jgi:hypothetical protein
MNNFKDFGIKPKSKSFEGEKIRLDKILNKEIIIEDFKIEKSKFEKGNNQCLYLQIDVNGVKRVLFTGSVVLQEMITQVSKENFPFTTTIVKENDRLEFT